ncbi:MAG: LptF/LptG family permease [Opitutae bacterium]|nr:LptF/LptG family permease [Opitutae bacterium]
MKLIHRHIFANVAVTCGWGVGLFTFVLMLGNFIQDLLSRLVTGQIGADTCLHLVGLSIPVSVSYALPMGMLTGILLVLGRMSSDREITALRACGLSVAGLSAPILFGALLGVGFTLVVNFEFMPRAKVAYEQDLAAALRQNPLNFIVPKTFIRDFPGKVIYVGEKRGQQLKDFWLWELDDQKRVRRAARADSGRLDYDEKENKLVLTLDHAQAEARDEKDPENFSQMRAAAAWEHATFDLPLDKLSGGHSVNRKMKWMTLGQLLAEWRRLGARDPKLTTAEREVKRIKVQFVMQEKFATAFSVLSFALIAIPLGIKVSRKETSANLGIALALAMGYYFCTVAVGWLDGHPAWRPDLLMWVPNLGFQALGVWMLVRVDRQ